MQQMKTIIWAFVWNPHEEIQKGSIPGIPSTEQRNFPPTTHGCPQPPHESFPVTLFLLPQASAECHQKSQTFKTIVSFLPFSEKTGRENVCGVIWVQVNKLWKILRKPTKKRLQSDNFKRFLYIVWLLAAVFRVNHWRKLMFCTQRKHIQR